MSSGVEFDEDSFNYKAMPRPGQPAGNVPGMSGGLSQDGGGNEPRMVRWLMAHGLAKSPRVAQAFLLVLVVINLIITFIVIKYFL